MAIKANLLWWWSREDQLSTKFVNSSIKITLFIIKSLHFGELSKVGLDFQQVSKQVS